MTTKPSISTTETAIKKNAEQVQDINNSNIEIITNEEQQKKNNKKQQEQREKQFEIKASGTTIKTTT